MYNENQTKPDVYDWVLSPEIREHMRTARPLTVEEKADIIDGGCRPIADKYAALSKPFSCSRFAQRKKS